MAAATQQRPEYIVALHAPSEKSDTNIWSTFVFPILSSHKNLPTMLFETIYNHLCHLTRWDWYQCTQYIERVGNFSSFIAYSFSAPVTISDGVCFIEDGNSLSRPNFSPNFENVFSPDYPRRQIWSSMIYEGSHISRGEVSHSLNVCDKWGR